MNASSAPALIMALALALVPVAGSWAAFEIEATTPSHRGAATDTPLGILEGSLNMAKLESPDSVFPLAVAAYGFRPFGVDEISLGAAWVAVPLKSLGSSLGFSYQRLEALSYVEETYLLSCRLGGERVRLLPQARLGVIRLGNRYLDWAALVDLGITVQASASVRICLAAQNPFGLVLLRSREACPSKLDVGLGYKISPGLAWGIEIEKLPGQATAIAAGVEARLIPGLLVRTGLRTNPESFCLGLGLRWKGLVIDSASSIDLELGLTHEVGVAYLWF